MAQQSFATDFHYKKLFSLFDKAGVPLDTRWRSLLLYFREIKDYPHLSDVQKIAVQGLLTDTLTRKDYSEENLQKVLNCYYNCIVTPYRKKTETLLLEVASLIQQFQKTLSTRCGDLDTLEATTVSIVESDLEPVEQLERLHSSFVKMKNLFKNDISSLETLATRDALTNIANRRAFDEFMGKAIDKWLTKGTPLSLAFFDVDFFKKFNDEHGHRIGDQVLVVVAKQLTKAYDCFSSSDVLVARYGGEEFVLAVSGPEASSLPQVAETIRAEIKNFNLLIRDADGNVVENGLHITASAGVATMWSGWTGSYLDNIVDCADKALYHAKHIGRDKAVEFRHDARENFSIISLSHPISR
ncbi:MAG: GGDEF domain-containing protein [Desulfovibrio sp.]|jgi:diguanylate cyclase (GGDEF)-like protein|nr:GGDEF domain-containing protein [Desulfovibrio sp.]